MATSYGWTGKILRVNLTTGKITETPTSDYAPKFIGGRGIAEAIYWEEVSPECAALSPENALIMMTGVADGTLLPSGSRLCVVSKSPVPLKECMEWSTPGGHVSAELKFAGYDGIVITGKSPKPVYLWIHDGKAEIRSAERLWGLLLSDMILQIYNLHGPQTRVAGIGPAGENLCRGAAIIMDREHATGVTGFGAVMGSKNLKCIAVRGTGAVNVAKPKEVIDLWYYYRRLLNRTPAEVKAGDGWPCENKSLTYYMYHSPHIPYCPGHPKEPEDPAVYFKNNGLDDPISLFREAVDKGTVKLKWGGCYSCSVCCGLTYQSTDADIPSGAGQCNDMESWPRHDWRGYKKVVGIPDIWFNRWSDDLGFGNTNVCGFQFEWWDILVEAGILTKENTGLPSLTETWTLPVIKGILEKIAYRQGALFDAMAEGEQRFWKGLVEKYPEVMNRKPSKTEAPILTLGAQSVGEYYNQRVVPKGWYVDKAASITGTNFGAPTGALMNATGARREINKVTGGFGKAGIGFAGLTAEQTKELTKRMNLKWFGAEDALEVSGEPSTWNNKVTGAIMCQNLSMLMDCITYCGWAGAYSLVSRYTPDHMGDATIGAKYYSAVTGIPMTHEQMVEAMNPLWNLERCIHVREGRRRKDDGLNDVIYKYKAWAWTSKQEFEGKVLDEYYTRRGWDLATGIPRRSILEKQGLKQIADDLENKYGVKVPA